MAQKALFKSQKKQKAKPPPANRHGKVVKHKGGKTQARLRRAAPAGACRTVLLVLSGYSVLLVLQAEQKLFLGQPRKS